MKKLKYAFILMIFFYVSISSCDFKVKRSKLKIDPNSITKSYSVTLIGKEVNSFYRNETLIVIDKDKKEISRVQLHAIDSLYRVVQSQDKDNLFIGLSSFGDAIFQFIGLINLKSKNWIFREMSDTKSDDWKNCILSNPKFIGTTTDNKYHLIEGGTGMIREFQICDTKGIWIKKGNYVTGVEDIEFNWDSSNRLHYFEMIDHLPISFPKPKEKFKYVQKKFWYNGKDSLTHEFKEIYFE